MGRPHELTGIVLSPIQFLPDRNCPATQSVPGKRNCPATIQFVPDRNCPATIQFVPDRTCPAAQFVARGIVLPPFSSWQEELSCHHSVRGRRNCPATIQFVEGGTVLPPISSFRQDVSCRPVGGKIHSSWQTAVVLSPVLVVANSNCPAIH